MKTISKALAVKTVTELGSDKAKLSAEVARLIEINANLTEQNVMRAAENAKLREAVQMEEDHYNLTTELFERKWKFYPSVGNRAYWRRAALKGE